MDKLANGVQFVCPQQEVIHQRTNDAFVDDVTGYANHFLHELQGHSVLSDIIQLMQTDASLWNGLLHISGGKLAFHKCLYYIVSWDWTQGNAHIQPANQIGQTIELSSPNGPTLPI